MPADGTRTSPLVTAFRNRAAETIGVGHDALGRLISKDLPGTEPDATYGYDLLGRLLSAAQNGITIAFTYDTLGRQLTQTIPIALIASPTFSSEWDLAGRRTRYTWPVDASSSTAYYVDYDYLVTGEMEKVREKGATSGAVVLATFGYDDRGRRASLTRGNGASTTYSYDSVSRLGSMTHDFGGSATTHDLTLGFAYNPANQIVEATRSNNLYAWTGHGSGTTNSTANGLNQLASHGGATATSDPKGNLTFDGTYTYAYSSENLLTSFGATGTLSYDPLMRFYRNYSTYFVHEGGQLVGDYYNGNIVGRYVPGAAGDEPVAQINKFGDRTGFHADERGSIIAGSNSTGANARIVTYDEYGKRGPGGSYRFAFTGQVHLLNDIYDYKARNYNARLGRFVQTDPIGYGDGMNIYAYVKGDPVNFTDPMGLQAAAEEENIVYIDGPDRPAPLSGGAGLMGASRERGPKNDVEDIVINGPRPEEPYHNIMVTAIISPQEPTPPGPQLTLIQLGPKRPGTQQDHCTGVSDRPNGVNIAGACASHDICYGSTTPRSDCDFQFYMDIREQCLNQGADQGVCFILALKYYIGVRRLGWPHYNPPNRR